MSRLRGLSFFSAFSKFSIPYTYPYSFFLAPPDSKGLEPIPPTVLRKFLILCSSKYYATLVSILLSCVSPRRKLQSNLRRGGFEPYLTSISFSCFPIFNFELLILNFTWPHRDSNPGFQLEKLAS